MLEAIARRCSKTVGRAVVLLTLLGACTTMTPLQGWEQRLQGDAVVLLGEVHDNAQQHRLRLELLRRGIAAGWRPAIAMEQFDREHQADIERARRERPTDAQHVIDLAALPTTRLGGGWNWNFYRPYVALALQYDLPLIAANLSNADTTKIVRGGLAAVFDSASIVLLGLDRPIADDWQLAQEREIDAGHCRALPPAMWPRLARAQFARDAVMAHALRQHAERGVVLLAGNGHVRSDIGVPRWLGIDQARVFTVAYLEHDDESTPASAFDASIRTDAAQRSDPCAGFKRPALATAAAARRAPARAETDLRSSAHLISDDVQHLALRPFGLMLRCLSTEYGKPYRSPALCPSFDRLRTVGNPTSARTEQAVVRR